MSKHGSRTAEAVARVVSELERDIIFGRYLPKQRLYEDEFMVGFSAKRHVVRAALVELERRGIVEKLPNRGAAVRYFSRQEVEDLYLLRAILHREGALRIRLPPDTVWFDRLREAHEAHCAAFDRRDLLAIFQTNAEFHRILFEGTGNAYLIEAIAATDAKTHGIRSHGLSVTELVDGAKLEHAAIIDAIEAGRLEQLAEICVKHIQPAKQFYLDKFCSNL
ncbi:GntR family transcriptional regulator [Jiella pelagia]|uniref:GntR family transcriptional regulator n=1 Tax=Jiella pelagia TaxID=2986949 RepID=A0ABY7C399_9HYPH|nr:GntR family transcriptional regulator [Jiella pelagia]WAP69810.1 GntR family transcriptional regulator [Jiella pelagia]